eukprot:481129-Amphidinium_carterae.1
MPYMMHVQGRKIWRAFQISRELGGGDVISRSLCIDRIEQVLAGYPRSTPSPQIRNDMLNPKFYGLKAISTLVH